MEGVTVVDHPLVQHKLTLIRAKNISTKSFRELLKEIGMLLCYEVTRDLPLSDVEIETPMARMMSPRIAGKKLVFAPILRAGVTFAEGIKEMIKNFRTLTMNIVKVSLSLSSVSPSMKAVVVIFKVSRETFIVILAATVVISSAAKANLSTLY